MKAIARIFDLSMTAAAVRYCTIALLIGLAPGWFDNGHAAGDAQWNRVEGLVSAAYFSDACRHEAELLGIERSADPRFLIAAFARNMATDTPDARAERRASAFDAGSGSAGCSPPVVGLINLLRLNGIAAELALVSTQPEHAPSELSALDKVERLLVYVPVLDRYFDPAALDLRENGSLDRTIKGNAVRAHLIGPAPFTDHATAACGSVCMVVYPPHNDPNTVRVVTEVIHAR